MKKLTSFIPFHLYHSRYYTYGELFYSLVVGLLFVVLIIYLRFLRTRTPRSVDQLIQERYVLVCLLFSLFLGLFLYTVWHLCGSPLPGRKDTTMSPAQERFVKILQPWQPWFHTLDEWRRMTFHAPQVVYEVWRQYFFPSFDRLIIKALHPCLHLSWSWWTITYLLCHVLVLQLLPLVLAWQVYAQGEIRLFYQCLGLMVIPLIFRLIHYICIHQYQCSLVRIRQHAQVTFLDGHLHSTLPLSAEEYILFYKYLKFYEAAEQRFLTFQHWIDQYKDLWALPRYGLYLCVWGYLVIRGFSWS